MKKILTFLCAATLLSALSARADVAWQHAGAVSVGGAPLVKFNVRNEWSNQNHRARLFLDATGLAMLGAPTEGAKGTLNVIERLGDDKIIIAPEMAGQSAQYVEEPYSTLKGRLRLNFWEGLDEKLANEEVPAFTPEQRSRLGRELRAIVSPLTKRFSRQYFRVLPQKRTIMGLESTGYRYTSLVIVPQKGAPDQVVRMNVEFWLAAPQEGDAEILGFTTAANNLKSSPATVSMWLNEYFPVVYETLPIEFQQTVEALLGQKGSPTFGYRGTPMQFFATVSPPAMMGMAIGDVRFAAELKSRSTSAVNETIFQAPTDARRVDIAPFLQIMKNGVRQGRTALEEQLETLFK